MAIHKHLPIYRDAQKLVHQLTVSTRKAPRDLRYTLVQQMVTEAVELCCDIADANRATDHARATQLEQLQRRTARIDILLQVATDQRCLSLGAAANAMEHLDAVGKQAFGWSRATNVSLGTPEPATST